MKKSVFIGFVVFAVLFAFAILYPDSTIYLYFVLPIPSAILIIGYFVLEFLQMFKSDGVAHLGHFFVLIVIKFH